MKRLLDIILASALVIMFAIPMIFIGALIRWETPGPILYRANRVGRFGSPFFMAKFRSMHVSEGGEAITASQDSRITRVGRWLRRTHLDELPQLFHILSGSMSFVGPRPEDPLFVDLEDARWEKILSVRPGMTGPSQLAFAELESRVLQEGFAESAYRSDVLPLKVEKDFRYAVESSLRIDMNIILRTLRILLMGSSSNVPNGKA